MFSGLPGGFTPPGGILPGKAAEAACLCYYALQLVVELLDLFPLDVSDLEVGVAAPGLGNGIDRIFDGGEAVHRQAVHDDVDENVDLVIALG